MLVKDIMLTEFITVTPSMSWREAAELLLKHRLSGAPVIDANGRLIGILSEKDLFRGLFPSHAEWAETPHDFMDFQAFESRASDMRERKVEDVMSRRVIDARPDTPVLKIGALMASSGIHHVPVVEKGKPIGMVNRGTIYRAILEKAFRTKG